MALTRFEKGLSHWKHQRITAAILALTVVGLMLFGIAGIFCSYDHLSSYLSNPGIKALCILVIGALFYHSFLGLKVIAEDYIPLYEIRRAILFILLITHILGGIFGAVLLVML